MSSLERESKRIVIAGASSLLGTELKSLLEETVSRDGIRLRAWNAVKLTEKLLL